jgi:hypothetical protein
LPKVVHGPNSNRNAGRQKIVKKRLLAVRNFLLRKLNLAAIELARAH